MSRDNHWKRERKERPVAIVEDDSYRATMERSLKSPGFRCFALAEDFVNFSQQQETDCLIADSRMSGLDLQSKLNSDHCPIETIFTTQKTPLLAMRTGGVEFLRKLFDAKGYLKPFEWCRRVEV
jgi:FixJ family two-component response regulator